MKVKIMRVLDANLDRYKKYLDLYNPVYENETCCVIELKSIDDLFHLSKDLHQDLLIDRIDEDFKIIRIYDDYIE